MEINLDLYNIIHLRNGNILLELKKAIETEYNLVLTDTSFYRACEKNIGKINIYEPTTLTPNLLNAEIFSVKVHASFVHPGVSSFG
mgnify:CR=1 FL=1